MPLPKNRLIARIDSGFEKYINWRAKRIGKHRKKALAYKKQEKQARADGKTKEAAKAESKAFWAEAKEQWHRTLKGDAVHARALLRMRKKK